MADKLRNKLAAINLCRVAASWAAGCHQSMWCNWKTRHPQKVEIRGSSPLVDIKDNFRNVAVSEGAINQIR